MLIIYQHTLYEYMNYIVFSIAGTRGEATFTNQLKYILKANICEIQVNRNTTNCIV